MVAHRIEVDGEQVRVVTDSKVIHSAKISTIAKLIYGTEVRPNFDLLPSGVRWMSSDRRTVMLEREPGLRLVALVAPGVFHTVPMPYQVLMVTFSEDFMTIENLYMGLAATSRGVQSVYDDMRPFYGIADYEMPTPTTLPLDGSGSSVGEVLQIIFQHCDMQMYKLWAKEGVESLDYTTLPDSAPKPEKGDVYPHFLFAEWWASQSVDDVLEFTFEAGIITPLQEFVAEIDPAAVQETTLEFFMRVTATAQEMDEEEERLRQEELARQEAERQAKLEAARPKKKIMLPARYLEGFDEMVANLNPETPIATSVNS